MSCPSGHYVLATLPVDERLEISWVDTGFPLVRDEHGPGPSRWPVIEITAISFVAQQNVLPTYLDLTRPSGRANVSPVSEKKSHSASADSI